MKPSTQPARQLLSTLFALDERYNKRILVGLEYKHLIDPSSYKPVIRLTSSGFRGIAFTAHCWQEFKKSFQKFSEFFFNREKEGPALERIEGPDWTAKLRKRTREIIITSGRNGCAVSLKRSDFQCLVDAAKCVDDRIQYLQAIQKCVSGTICEYYSLLNVYLNDGDGQITMYTRSLIEAANEKMRDSVVSDIVNKIEINDNVPFTANDVVIVLHEIVAFHTDEIIESFNYELMYQDYLDMAEEEKKEKEKMLNESL